MALAGSGRFGVSVQVLHTTPAAFMSHLAKFIFQIIITKPQNRIAVDFAEAIMKLQGNRNRRLILFAQVSKQALGIANQIATRLVTGQQNQDLRIAICIEIRTIRIETGLLASRLS